MTTISLTASLTRGRTLFPGVLACAVLSTAATFLSQHNGAPARAPTGSGGSPISSRLSSPRFSQAPRHPKWREVNLAAEVPGWRRFEPARLWLERQTSRFAVSDDPRLKADFDRFAKAKNLSGEEQEKMNTLRETKAGGAANPFRRRSLASERLPQFPPRSAADPATVTRGAVGARRATAAARRIGSRPRNGGPGRGGRRGRPRGSQSSFASG